MCRLYFTNPRPTESAISKYYNNPDYVSHTDKNSGLLFRLYQLVKDYTLSRKLFLLNSLTNSRRILDYGAGTGDFASKMATSDWKVTAYEPDHHAKSKILNKNNSIKVVDSLDSLPSGSFDVITLWHVLEHVHSINTTLYQFFNLLAPGGHLLIAVPNKNSYDARHYGPNWAAYDVPRHLYHFTPDTLIPFMSRYGLVHKVNRPMWFDSFYVSLLSEKNLTNNDTLVPIGWVRAVLVGTASNFHALFNTGNCSSVIYIFQKPL
jgi:ubiquinone/menaquinone biosynthesis C-methylase UbiE